MAQSAKDLPNRLKLGIGEVTIAKGTDDGNMLFSWDAINDCTGERCIADEFCTYARRGKCSIQMQYLKAFNTIMFRNFKDVLSESDWYYVGMHLTPLYKTLCRLKIEELAVTRIVDTDEKGIRRVNPLYKEIRETVKLINALWKSLGLTNSMAPIPSDPDFDNSDDVIEGQVGSPMETEKAVKRLKKR